MPTIFWKRDHPELWARIPALPELEPFERHIPVSQTALRQWRAELPFHGNSQYGQMLKRDIAYAEKCNTRADEMIVSFRTQTIAA